MAIRLVDTEITVAENLVGSGFTVFGGGAPIGMPLAGTDTLEEAEKTKRALENVLLPRFTRDEAIAIVWKRIASPAGVIQDGAFAVGVRAALEALAAAGVFVPECSRCETNDSDHFCESMADLLDAAGIK